jgi:lipoprotein signal peptidase
VATSKDNGLPLWARLIILLGLAALLIFNVASRGDSALSLLIAGGLFAAIGIDANARNRGGA